MNIRIKWFIKSVQPAAEYTTIIEKRDNENTINQITLSPFKLIFFQIRDINYSALTAFLNCKPLSSKFLNKSKLAQAGDNKTV